MELSHRIKRLSPSPTLALDTKAKALAKKGIKVFNFAVGEPDFPTPECIVNKAIESLKKGRTKYGPSGGGEELRTAIAQKLQNENHMTFAPDQIVVGIGAKEILLHVFLSILNEGDEVILPTPYWVSYSEQIKVAGGQTVALPLAGREDSQPFTLESLEKAASKRVTAIVLTSPNNPGGYVLREPFLKELGAYLCKKNWWIISDEIYEYLAFDAPHKSLLNLCPELKERFILINGLSKGFAMTGWRVGYGAGPKDVMKLVKMLQGHSSTCLPGFIEDAATLAIKEGVAMMRPDIERLKARRDLAVSCLKKIPDLCFSAPEGAFYIFMDVRKILDRSKVLPKKDTLALGEWLIDQHQIALVPGEAFGAPGFLRLSYATGEDAIRGGIERLQGALASV